MDIFADLEALLRARKTADPETSYAARLHRTGLNAILQKLGEEMVELLLAAKDMGATGSTSSTARAAVVHEGADLLFHLLLLLAHLDVPLVAIQEELKLRSGVSGLMEKAARRHADPAPI